MTALYRYFAIHPREDAAHVVRLPFRKSGGLRVRIGVVSEKADCGAALDSAWALIPEVDWPDTEPPPVCEACKAAAPPPALGLDTEPPTAAATERPAGPPRKPGEIAAELERIRDEIKSPRLRYFLTRTIEALRGSPAPSRHTRGPQRGPAQP